MEVILGPEEKKEEAGVEVKEDDKKVDEAARGLEELNLNEGEIDHNRLRQVLVKESIEEAKKILVRYKLQFERLMNNMDPLTRKNWWRGLTTEQLNLVLENLHVHTRVSDAIKSRIDRVKKEGPDA